jgi:serine/threonine protein kinase
MNCPFCEADNPSGDNCVACGHPLGDTAIIRRGSLIATRYEITGMLGRGGMGVVYKAFDHTLEDPVAIKALRPDVAGDSDLVRRFRQEIRLARRVRHRNVCAIHEYAEDGALRCLAMELVEGMNLKQIIDQRGRFGTEEAFALSIQVADGLQAIHDAGIIHRDLKTANLMRDPQGLLRLMDFGIAKEWRKDVTATSQVLGTPEYVSPEQARGERVDFRSDIYALGIVMFEIFTGQVPFRGETALGTIMMHVHDSPPLDTVLGFPESMLPVLRRALAKDPALRHQRAAELGEELRQIGAATIGSAFHTPTTPLPSVTPLPFSQDTTYGMAPPSLAGDLKMMKLSVILRWISSGEKTGVLHLDGESVQKRIVFSEGTISSSWSNDPTEFLGQFLVRSGLVTEEQLFKALLKQEQQGRLLGTILVAEGALTEEQFLYAMRLKAEESIYELFLWEAGRFEFLEDESAHKAPIKLSLAVPDVVAEGTRRRDDWARIRKAIPSGMVTFSSCRTKTPRSFRANSWTPSRREYVRVVRGP